MSFEPHLRKFYVSAEDPFYIKELKLEILTRIATEGNISQILKEFQVFFFFSFHFLFKVCLKGFFHLIF